MKTYTAVDEFGLNIISVGADNISEARTKIREQLERPGRRQFLERWIKTQRKLQPQDYEFVKNSPDNFTQNSKPQNKQHILEALNDGYGYLIDENEE